MPHSSELLQAIKDPVKLEAYLKDKPQDINAVDEHSDDSILMKVTDSFLETGNENYRRSMLVLLRKGARHESWLEDSHEEIAHDLIAARKKFKDFEARSYKKTEASSKPKDISPEASLHKKAEARLQLKDVTPKNLVEAIRQHIEDGIGKAIKLLRMQCERYQSQSAENPRRNVVIVGTDHCSFESNLFFEEVKEAMKRLGKTFVLSEIGSEKLCPKERDKFVTFYNKSSSWTPDDVAFTVSLAARNEPDAAATSNSFSLDATCCF